MPLDAGGIAGDAAVEAGAGVLLAEAGAAGAAAGGGVLPPCVPSLPPLGLLHPPIAKPIQATAIPSAVRFMVFS